MKINNLLLSAAIAVLLSAGAAGAATVTVSGRQILLDGQPFTIKGVCYSPVPPGNDHTFLWGNKPVIYGPDLGYIKGMGANAIRTYQEHNITREFLDAAYANGIYVIVGWSSDMWDKNFSAQATRDMYTAQFVAFVNKWKHHPAILMWCFGNEISLHTSSPVSDWYLLVQQAAAAAKLADPAHLVTTSCSDRGEAGSAAYGATDAHLPALDVWGINVYRGRSFGNFFVEMSAMTAKPYYVSEWGCDAFNGITNTKDELLQDTYISSQWTEIAANLAADGGKCSGGTFFEWTAEWWKSFTNPLGNSAQDTVTDWTGPSYDDPNMNEEWWGIVSIDNAAKRAAHQAYHTLRNLWTRGVVPSGQAGLPIFHGDVRNYPNPFVPGAGSTRIEFMVAGNPDVEVGIFDLEGRKISDVPVTYRGVSGLVSADWSGKDENNSDVPSGLYIARVKARASGKEETKYRKIAVVK